jgi:hypothetical protein
MSHFKSFVNVIREAILKASDSLLGENRDLPKKHFKEKKNRVKAIKNEPITHQKQEAVLEPIAVIMDYSVLINKESIIPCPICNTSIPFNAQNLLEGASFICLSCSAAVRLPDQSRPIVERTINKLEELKSIK